MHSLQALPTPKVVLGIAAHPDDLDYYAGGTMAAFAGQGAAVYYLVLTDGGKGTDDRSMTPERLRDLRREEQRAAGQILGVKDIFFCDYADGALENTIDVKRDIVKVIRQVKPDVVVALDPTVSYIAKDGFINHSDHRAAGQAALDAVYPLARDHLSFPELVAQGLEPHKTSCVLLINFSVESATFGVDITDYMDVKLRAVAAHVSQFKDVENMQAVLPNQAKAVGQVFGYASAEAFIRIDVE